jgi:hypothetical protein
MRYLIIIVAFLTAVQAIEVDNPQARRALDNFTTASSQANERMEAEIRAATVRHNAAIEAATARAVRDVAGLINTRLGPAEQATLYRVLLALDPQHRDARQFFGAVGTLDTVLEEAEAFRHQLLGTIPGAGEVAASPAVAVASMDLLAKDAELSGARLSSWAPADAAAGGHLFLGWWHEGGPEASASWPVVIPAGRYSIAATCKRFFSHGASINVHIGDATLQGPLPADARLNVWTEGVPLGVITVTRAADRVRIQASGADVAKLRIERLR